MQSPVNPEGKNRPAGRIAIISGIILLFATAFFWSADKSLRLIFLGTAIYSFFMAVWLRPQLISGSLGRMIEGLNTDFRTIVKKKKRPAYVSPATRARVRAKPGLMLFSLFFISLIFFVLVMSVAFFSGDVATEGPDPRERAEYFRNSGEYDSAIANYRKVLQIAPNDVEANTGIGIVFFQQDAYDSALKYFDRSLQSDPTNESSIFNKALLLYYQKDYRGSLDFARETLRFNSDHMNAILLIGDNYHAEGLYDSALVWYEEAYEKGERSPELLQVIGSICDTRGDNEKAIRFYRETLQYDSTKVEIYERLAELYGGDAGEAFRQLADRYRPVQ